MQFILNDLTKSKICDGDGHRFKNGDYMKRSQIKHRLTKNFLAGFAIALGLLGGGIFAVAVTGTFNTFTSGSVMKAADINANFASLKAAIEGIPAQPTMRLIYEYDVPSATTSVNIAGLNGDTDMNYIVTTRIVNGNPNMDYFLQFNADTNTSNYGKRTMVHTDGISYNNNFSNSEMGIFTGGHGSAGSNGISFSKLEIYAKSGTMRFSIYRSGHFTSTTSWSNHAGYAWWTNTASNITSMTLTTNVANAIGAGSHIEVWARR